MQRQIIERLPYISESALKKTIKRNVPFILTGAIDHWPALSKWSLDYLSKQGGKKNLACEVGSLFDCTRVSEDGDILAIKRAHAPLSRIINSIIKRPDQTIYLSEWNVFDDCPHLCADIDLSRPRLFNPLFAAKPKCFIGPASAFTPTHYDHAPNFTAQIIGRKQWTLYDPSQLKYLHLYPRFSQMSHFSRAHSLDDLSNYEKFPWLRHVTSTSVVINPGEVLYIPLRWAHHVTSLDHSVSLHFFWKTCGMYLKQLAYKPFADFIGIRAGSNAKLNIKHILS